MPKLQHLVGLCAWLDICVHQPSEDPLGLLPDSLDDQLIQETCVATQLLREDVGRRADFQLFADRLVAQVELEGFEDRQL